MHERESAPPVTAPRREPTPAVPQAASVAALNAVLDPPRVLAMQRTAGNAATTRYLQHAAADPPEPPH
jgi:hypothetical protein